MAREDDEEEVVEDAVAEGLENKGCGIGRVLFRSIQYCGPVTPSSSIDSIAFTLLPPA